MEAASRDLLCRFTEGTARWPAEAASGDSVVVELSLGLSLNGRFGEDPKGRPLRRSSSLSGGLELQLTELHPFRARSLPVEVTGELRKRKEMRSQRRQEAKRRRWEKQSNLCSVKDTENLARDININGTDSNSSSSYSSQGSVGSKGCSSSGSSNCLEVKSPISVQFLQGNAEDKDATITTSIAKHKKTAMAESREREMKSNSIVMEEMPWVCTAAEGPDGRRVEGFLYKYGKGEEVRIVCICHGRFLSPAEFVRHGGGGDVANPLRHILVNPTPYPSL